ncbi:molybdopterin-dependent oxidoreductase [Pelagibacterium sp. H642]|uniref:molybdopterin-dependent oxidoreductase n=1 Tax=Pelagibacterium sp. H642 TaxID=1881069 RepID=UPI0028164CFE|nr:molybdopterin-dependent oxidoreductase [Pelagibacterium sp. H642]WMT92604.1 molybdopterin-dependent oxidoreductase [Pelagibacterium sp. H642]
MILMRTNSALIAAALATCMFVSQAIAAQTDLPAIVVKGHDSGSPVSKTFDRHELEQMGMVSIKTTTPWNEGVVDFEGVPFEQILSAAGVSGTIATVTALNDYSVDIPVSDFSQFGVILAIKRNGEYMPVADQGPFFVIYPFDKHPALDAQPYHGRAVWQVKEIVVE